MKSPSVQARLLPEHALLSRYGADGGYADCYEVVVAGRVSHAALVEAFYTTRLFKLERWVLATFVARPATDQDAAQLARGERSRFGAWDVEERAEDQLLLRDFQGRTRSWLMTLPGPQPGTTRLLFGSAVVPIQERRTGERRMGAAFQFLLGFHRLYSRALLAAAARRLAATAEAGSPRPG